MTAFISSKWQGTRTRVPGVNITLTDDQSKKVIAAVLPFLPNYTRSEVIRFLDGKIDRISRDSAIIAGSVITAYAQTMLRKR